MAAQEHNAGAGVLLFSENPEMVGELLTIGRQLAGRLGGTSSVAVLGAHTQAVTDEARACGADDVLLVQTPRGDAIIAEDSLAAGLREVIRATRPTLVLVGATRIGAGIAAGVAQMLQVPCASNCIALELDADGALRVERRVYGGRFVVRQRLSGAPCIATVPPKRFARAATSTGAGGRVRSFSVEIPQSRQRTLSVSERSRSQVDVTKAEVIVSAGRGVKSKEDLRSLETLAGLLGGVLAGSRPLTGDVDWLPQDRRIGLSGQTVKPNLYVACGISGQIEHIVGMKGSRTVVAINSDAKAPIHAEADYSIIGDLYDVVPALIRACERAGGKTA